MAIPEQYIHFAPQDKLTGSDIGNGNLPGPELFQQQDPVAETEQFISPLQSPAQGLLGLTSEGQDLLLGDEFKAIRAARRAKWEETGEVPPIVGGAGRKPIELPVEEIVELYHQGISSEEIAQKFGVHSQTIRNRLSEAGVELEWGGYRWSGEGREGIGAPKIELPLDEIRRLYEEEQKTAEEIARIYGCFERTVRSRLEEMSAPLRRGRPKRRDT